MRSLCMITALTFALVASAAEEGASAAGGYTVARFDVPSTAVGGPVPTSALLPAGFDRTSGVALPLVVWLHGGGGNREHLPRYRPWLDELTERGVIPPMVFASFSTSAFSGFLGPWEQFIADELPRAMAERYGTRTDREGVAVAGISMGGYGALKSAFRSPERFVAVGAMEPSVEPTLTSLPNHTRNTWTRGPAPSLGVADNPARLAHDNAAAIRASGLAIYLEVGDEDYLNLHDGTEFVHRVLWDHDVPHEYHLVRWADHTGASMRPRFGEMMGFIATALAGGRSDPVSFPLTEAEQELLAEVGRRATAGEAAPEEFSTYLLGPRGPTVHAQAWSPLRALAEDDPELARRYARLPPTTLNETEAEVVEE